jgi:ATP synthase protein I
MQAIDARLFWRSAVPTAIAGLILVIVGGVAFGLKGVWAALIGLGVVTVFFAISTFAVGRAAKIGPSAMMGTALGTFLLKIVVLIILVAEFGDTKAFNGRYFGIAALLCILVWMGGQVWAMVKMRIPYVEPNNEAPSGFAGVGSGGRR